MRKKILGIVGMAAVALATGWNISQSNNDIQLSYLTLSNVEALPSGEDGYDQWGYKFVNNCCKAYQPREYRCSTVWPDC